MTRINANGQALPPSNKQLAEISGIVDKPPLWRCPRMTRISANGALTYSRKEGSYSHLVCNDLGGGGIFK